MEVRILNRTPYNDLTKGPPGVPSVMITFQLPDFRVGSVSIASAGLTPLVERKAIEDEVKRMGRPAGEVITI